MQKIFSQELRFKDENGNDYPDWEEKKMGQSLQCLVEVLRNQQTRDIIKGIFHL